VIVTVSNRLQDRLEPELTILIAGELDLGPRQVGIRGHEVRFWISVGMVTDSSGVSPISTS
jgi:hypothetical protein